MRLHEDTLSYLREAGDHAGVWVALFQLTVMTVMTATLDEPERATNFGEECLALSDAGAHLSRSWALWTLAISRWLTSDRHAAGTLVRDSLRINQPSNRWGLAHGIEMPARIAAAERHYRRAARLLGPADPSGDRPASTCPRSGIWRSPTTSASGKPAGHSAPGSSRSRSRAGTRLTTDEAITYALGLQPSRTSKASRPKST